MDAALFDTLAEENDAVYIAVGAQESLPLGIPGEDAAGVLDQLSFLSAVRGASPRASAPTPSSSGRGIPQWTAPVPPDASWGKTVA